MEFGEASWPEDGAAKILNSSLFGTLPSKKRKSKSQMKQVDDTKEGMQNTDQTLKKKKKKGSQSESSTGVLETKSNQNESQGNEISSKKRKKQKGNRNHSDEMNHLEPTGPKGGQHAIGSPIATGGGKSKKKNKNKFKDPEKLVKVNQDSKMQSHMVDHAAATTDETRKKSKKKKKKKNRQSIGEGDSSSEIQKKNQGPSGADGSNKKKKKQNNENSITTSSSNNTSPTAMNDSPTVSTNASGTGNNKKKKKKRKRSQSAEGGENAQSPEVKKIKPNPTIISQNSSSLKPGAGELVLNKRQKHRLKQKERRQRAKLNEMKMKDEAGDNSKSKKSEDKLGSPVNKVSEKQSTKRGFKQEKLAAILQEKAENSTNKEVAKDEPNQKSKKKSALGGNSREELLDKLKGARFRYLNEQLYSITSSAANDLFREDKEAFQIYHQGFQAQAKKWPVNPLEKIIGMIKRRPPSHVVADFGCGDAQLAASVKQKVHSFDLVAVNKNVIACDMANVPLENEAVDIAVFCLALMGTNVTDFIVEANRVLRKGGILLIAEISNRFSKVNVFLQKLHSLGFKKVKQECPNSMFIWFEFKKVKDAPTQKAALPTIELKPCVYKKR